MRLGRQLEQFQAPNIQEWLTRDPDFLKQPVRQDAAVVFIDLSGFTSLSERLGPDTIRELLKDFHALVDREAVSSGGMITRFLGDGAMILFGLPQAAPDDAVQGGTMRDNALRQRRRMACFLAGIDPFKVGAHFGTIVALRLGGGSYHHITATGDTVNIANRLMEIADRHGVEFAVSDELFSVGGRGSPLLEAGTLTGPVETRVRGRSGSLDVWLWRTSPANS